jgi:hypothetical protein
LIKLRSRPDFYFGDPTKNLALQNCKPNFEQGQFLWLILDLQNCEPILSLPVQFVGPFLLAHFGPTKLSANFKICKPKSFGRTKLEAYFEFGPTKS